MTTSETAPAPQNLLSRHEENKGFPKWAKVTAGCVAIAAAVGFGTEHGSGSDSKATPSRPVAAAEAVPGQQNLDPASITSEVFRKELTRVQQLDYAAPMLNLNTGKMSQQYRDDLRNMGWNGRLDRQIAPVSAGNTAQEIWDQITLGEYKSWKTAQDGNIEEAKKLASVVAEGKEYDDLIATFQNGGTFVDTEGAAGMPLPVITSGSYKGVEAKGYGLIEFKKRSASNSDDVVNVVAQLEKGTGDNSSRWVLVKTTSVN